MAKKVNPAAPCPATGYLVGNNNPFTWGLGWKVDMRNPFFGTTAALVVTDFQAATGKTAVATFSATLASNWYSAVLNAIGRAYVNKTGATQFRLRFYKDENNDNAADYMKFYGGNYPYATSRPMLVVEYYVPKGSQQTLKVSQTFRVSPGIVFCLNKCYISLGFIFILAFTDPAVKTHPLKNVLIVSNWQ